MGRSKNTFFERLRTFTAYQASSSSSTIPDDPVPRNNRTKADGLRLNLFLIILHPPEIIQKSINKEGVAPLIVFVLVVKLKLISLSLSCDSGWAYIYMKSYITWLIRDLYIMLHSLWKNEYGFFFLI